MLKVGVGKGEITPTSPCRMGGYIARTGLSVGKHDALYAKCFYFQWYTLDCLYIVLDLLGISIDWINKVRNFIYNKLIRTPNIIISCNHTHSGPYGFEQPISREKPDPIAVKALFTGIKTAVMSALSNLEPCYIDVQEIDLPGIGLNRNVPKAPIYQGLWVLSLYSLAGALKGALAVFPVHSTVLGPDNLLFTGDLLGFASQLAEAAFPAQNPVIAIACGAAGDVSTRFTRQEQSFAELERFSIMLKDALIQLIQRGAPHECATFQLVTHSFDLTLAKPFLTNNLEYLEKSQYNNAEHVQINKQSSPQLRICQAKLEGIKKRLNELGSLTNKMLCEIAGIRIDNKIIICVPAELPNSSISIIRNKFKFLNPVIITLTNGYIGYLFDNTQMLFYENIVSNFNSETIHNVMFKICKIIELLA